MVQKVLNLATEESDNPDLRDRGYIYWRLLSSDPEAARAVVLSEKPAIGDDTFQLEPSLLEDLMGQIATLASIYHKPPEAFVVKSVAMHSAADEEDEPEEEPLGLEDGGASTGGQTYGNYGGSSGGGGGGGGGDLLDLMDDMSSGGAPAPSSSSAANVKKVVIVTPEAGKGVFISAAMAKVGGQPALLLDVGNQTATPAQALAVQLNKSTFGLAPVNPQIMLAHAVANGSTCAHTFPLSTNPSLVTQDASPAVQAAIKNMATGDVFYFAVPVAVEALFVPHPAMDVNALAAAWKGVDEGNEVSALVNDLPTADVEAVKAKLAANDVVFSTRRDVPGADGVPQVPLAPPARLPPFNILLKTCLFLPRRRCTSRRRRTATTGRGCSLWRSSSSRGTTCARSRCGRPTRPCPTSSRRAWPRSSRSRNDRQPLCARGGVLSPLDRHGHAPLR